jgi:putative transport protein
MTWLAATFAKYPELAVFLVIGLGYWIGSFKIRGFGLGPVTGSLIVGLAVGAYFSVPIAPMAKGLLFLLFLFAIGYSVGPKFFEAMKGDGLRWAFLAVVMCVAGLAAAYVVARILDLDPGFAGGLVSGALTESPAIGTATEAINALPLAEAERARLVGHVAVADAICYVFGAFGVIVFCSAIGPRLLGIDLVAEARKAEADLGIDRSQPGVASAWRPFEMRAFRVGAGGSVAGWTVARIEQMLPGARIFVEGIRRGQREMDVMPDTVVQADDVVAVSGPREALTRVGTAPGIAEVDDRELLDQPAAAFDVYVSSAAVAGRTLADLAGSDLPLRGVFLRKIMRGGHAIEIAPLATIERGDVVRLVGAEAAVRRAASAVGDVVQPTDTAVALMTALGLAAFVGMIGLGAGPHFVDAMREAGVGLFFGGIVVTSVPLFVGLYFGRYVLKLNPVLLLGGIAGAQTMTAGLAAVQERSDSPVAVLGYSGTVAIGHILLTMWGLVIVRLVT